MPVCKCTLKTICCKWRTTKTRRIPQCHLQHQSFLSIQHTSCLKTFIERLCAFKLSLSAFEQNKDAMLKSPEIIFIGEWGGLACNQIMRRDQKGPLCWTRATPAKDTSENSSLLLWLWFSPVISTLLTQSGMGSWDACTPDFSMASEGKRRQLSYDSAGQHFAPPTEIESGCRCLVSHNTHAFCSPWGKTSGKARKHVCMQRSILGDRYELANTHFVSSPLCTALLTDLRVQCNKSARLQDICVSYTQAVGVVDHKRYNSSENINMYTYS